MAAGHGRMSAEKLTAEQHNPTIVIAGSNFDLDKLNLIATSSQRP